MTTMPEPTAPRRIGAAGVVRLTEAQRIDLSAVIGLDVDLVLTAEHAVDDAELTDADRSAALFDAFADEAARLTALRDMLDCGFVDVPTVYGRLAVLADELGLDDTAAVSGGWAA